ncbi:hypothetical protein [Nonomuraea diastatica]|uniref:Uncharacterized protein n=1 Tax=Nonomuraea diastatica TaxID=1848329 RepID=A0A4R4WAZ3_9ACTN|nr:hypothetical protein [Nonomuraea diastatica]TDD15301.1 hypothetical protein E1294_34935 [Nonomuraea diastatica]
MGALKDAGAAAVIRMKGIDNRPGGKWRASILRDLFGIATSPATGQLPVSSVETGKADARHVVSGKKRASPERQREARRTVPGQKDRDRRLGGRRCDVLLALTMPGACNDQPPLLPCRGGSPSQAACLHHAAGAVLDPCLLALGAD